MSLLPKLLKVWSNPHAPFLVGPGERLTLAAVQNSIQRNPLKSIRAGVVVALIGDFTPRSIAALFQLIDLGAVIVPLTTETQADHNYFFETSGANWVLHAETGELQARQPSPVHPFIQQLRSQGHGGLVLFSTGTTGRPKAILHDLTVFMRRFETPRPSLVTLNFLLFDHIGGLNTLFHALF